MYPYTHTGSIPTRIYCTVVQLQGYIDKEGGGWQCWQSDGQNVKLVILSARHLCDWLPIRKFLYRITNSTSCVQFARNVGLSCHSKLPLSKNVIGLKQRPFRASSYNCTCMPSAWRFALLCFLACNGKGQLETEDRAAPAFALDGRQSWVEQAAQTHTGSHSQWTPTSKHCACVRVQLLSLGPPVAVSQLDGPIVRARSTSNAMPRVEWSGFGLECCGVEWSWVGWSDE